jgi:hypothetical protein
MPKQRSFTCQLALALLVPQIRTDHAHHTVAADDLAIAAHLFYRSANFHGFTLS